MRAASGTYGSKLLCSLQLRGRLAERSAAASMYTEPELNPATLQPLELITPLLLQPGFTGKQPMLLESINKVGRGVAGAHVTFCYSMLPSGAYAVRYGGHQGAILRGMSAPADPDRVTSGVMEWPAASVEARQPRPWVLAYTIATCYHQLPHTGAPALQSSPSLQ